MKKAIIIVLTIIVLCGIGWFGYNYYANMVENGEDNIEEESSKQYVLNKITDWTNTSIEFYDEFNVYNGGYVLYFRDVNSKSNVVVFDKNGKVITNELYKFDENSNLNFRQITDDLFVITGSVNGKERNVLFNTNFDLVLDKENYAFSASSSEKYLVIHDTSKELYGLYDLSGKELIAISYEYLCEIMGKKYFFAQKNGKTGIIDINNNIIVPFEYDKFVTKNIFYTASMIGKNGENVLISKNGVKRVIDINNKEIINIDAESKNYSTSDINYSNKNNIYFATFDKVAGEHSLVKIYDDTGKFIKDIELGNTYKLRINNYNDNSEVIQYITFVDSNDISYKLNSNYELEKIGKLYCRPNEATGSIYNCYYGGDITVKVNDNNKYVVYDNKGNKLVDNEFALLRFFDKYVYGCLEKIDEYTGNNCGYFNYNGQVMFDFKYDGSSADKIFELRNGELYAVSLDKIISKVGSLEKNDYFMQVKDFVTVDSRINGEFKRDLYNINGELLFNGIWNIDGIMNDKLISVEYYNKNDKYNTKVYKIDDLGNQLFSNVQLIKKIVSNKKIIYFADDGIYELVEE